MTRINTKPGPVAKARAAKAAKDKRHADKVRDYVMNVRDEYCRVGWDLDCEGPLQWMHLGEKQRFKTRGMTPEQRHSSKWTIKGCAKHHGMYDRGEIDFVYVTEDGADGPIEWQFERVQ